ncbi:sensor histidine kinase [Mycobacterium sp. NPDC003323]
MTDSASSATPDGSEWHWLWQAYVIGMLVVAMIAVALLQHRFGGNVPVSVAALTALLAVVVLPGRWIIRRNENMWYTAAFIGVVVVLWTVAMAASPVAITAVPALYPLFFAAVPLVPALVVTTAVNLVPLLLVLIGGLRSPNLSITVAITLIAVVSAPIIGTVIMTSMKQRRTLAAAVAELAASRAEAARLSRLAGVAAERERLSREIHDTLAQGFTSIVTLSQAVQAELDADRAAADRHIGLIESTARENLAEARQMVASLTPAALGDDTLPAAIRRQCARLTAEIGMPVAVHIDEGLASAGMGADVVLLRAAQEALSNIRRHSHADAVTVALTRDAQALRLTVSDNGIGLDERHCDGFGLRGMRSRVAQVGGTVTVSSDHGVRVEVTVPL